MQAGLLLAETEYVKQVESDIASYKGLLMGLFFMTVGMEISVGLFFARYKTVLAAMAILIGGKVHPHNSTHTLTIPVVNALIIEIATPLFTGFILLRPQHLCSAFAAVLISLNLHRLFAA